MKLQPLIKSLKLDWVNDSINDKNFPYEKTKGKVELLAFKKYISTEDALKEMDEKGFRPATIHEMLSWVKNNWNGKDWVVALGSVWQDAFGGRYVAYLCGRASERELHLYWVGGGWHGDCRFLVVRKSLDTRTLGASSPLDPLVKVELPQSVIEALRKAITH